MGYINLVAYIQCEIDNILRDIQDWAWAYINNIIYDRSFLANLFCKFRVIFEIFLYYNISINSIKSYFNYPNIGFFSQPVISLGLMISDKMLKAIRFL